MSLKPAQLAQLKQALAHHQAGRLELARSLYDQVRRVAPIHFDAAHLAGVLAYQQGRHEDAEKLLSLALRINPKSTVAEMRLGLTHQALGRQAEALTRFRRLVRCSDTPPECWIHLARALREAGDRQEARAAAEIAVQRLPNSIDAFRVLARTAIDQQGMAASVAPLQRLTELAPADPLNWADCGIALAWAGDVAAAEAALQKGLGIDPQLQHAHLGLGFAYQQAHRIPEAVERYSWVVQRDPANEQAQSSRLLCMHYLDDVRCEELFAAHQEYGQAIAPVAVDPLPPPPSRDRLRVGFLSCDFRRHSVAYFIAPLLRHLDRTRFEIFLYHDHHQVDGMSEKLQALADQWKNFAGASNAVVEAKIRADQLDILVDLAGHTAFNRLSLFARRLAPTQVTYLGYPDTTGIQAMDFRLVDAITDPVGEADRLHTETLVRFAPTAWAYEPPAEAPLLAELPSRCEEPIVFGSFNAFGKISDRTLHVWGRILERVPSSRLLLKGHGLDDSFVQDHVLRRAAAAGIARERVDLLGRTPNLASHLSLYGRMDVALDPLPYSGTTTTCEALWMGKPVVTLAGDRHASRVTSSLLTAIGRQEWCATSEESYIAIACQLAGDRERLHREAQTLRGEMQQSPLCDYAEQAKRFGDALRECCTRRSAEVSAPS